MALKNVKVTISRGEHYSLYAFSKYRVYGTGGKEKDRPFGWQDGVRQEVFQRLDSGFFLFRRCHS